MYASLHSRGGFVHYAHTHYPIIDNLSSPYMPSHFASYKTQSKERRSITNFSVQPFIYSQGTNSFKFQQNRK